MPHVYFATGLWAECSFDVVPKHAALHPQTVEVEAEMHAAE